MVLGQYRAVLVGTWSYWVSITWCCLVLSGTGLIKGFYASIYWKINGDVDQPTNQQGKYRAICLFRKLENRKKAEICNNSHNLNFNLGGGLLPVAWLSIWVHCIGNSWHSYSSYKIMMWKVFPRTFPNIFSRFKIIFSVCALVHQGRWKMCAERFRKECCMWA